MTSKPRLGRLDRWRLIAAESIVRQQATIGESALNRAVQRALLDAAFLEICSRRGLGGAAELLAYLNDGGPAAVESPPADLPPLNIDDPPGGLPDDLLGGLHQRMLARPLRRTGNRIVIASSRSDRQGRGVYYTPTFVVDYIVGQTLGPLVEGEPTIIDPACGAGVFLVRACEFLAAAQLRGALPRNLTTAPAERAATAAADQRTPDRLRIVERHLFGVDRDPIAVRSARLSLALHLLGGADAVEDSPARIAAALRKNIRCGDSLLGTEFLAAGRFDAVVGNPPYVNIRRITQQLGPQAKQRFGQRYRCARGSYDLYVLFIERAYDLLRAGGRFGMIVPNKLATLGYARACRELLLQRTTIEEIVDVGDMRIFQNTGVYPWILVWRKQPPTDRQHLVRVIQPGPAQRHLSPPLPVCPVRQSGLSAERGFHVAGHLDVESRVATVPLGELADLHSGTTGFSAGRMAAELIESGEAAVGGYFDFIVSGNIDRYQIIQGNVRFMKRTYRRPLMPDNSPCLSRNKRNLFAGPKIVLAGMTRRLEAAYDPGGKALGVQVYAVSNPRIDPHYLLAVLNSRLLSQLFRQRFSAKRLGGGYLAINKTQLSQLPIRKIDFRNPRDRESHDQLVTLAQRLTHLSEQLPGESLRHNPPSGETFERTDAEIDTLVERLYDVGQQELAA